MNKILHIENLDCPVCAEALQSDLQKVKGVLSVCVDYVTQTISLDVEDEMAIAKAIKVANGFEEVRVLDGGRYEVKKEKHLKEWLMIALSSMFFLVAILLEKPIGGKAAQIIAYVLYGVSYLVVGYPVLLSTAKNIARSYIRRKLFDDGGIHRRYCAWGNWGRRYRNALVSAWRAVAIHRGWLLSKVRHGVIGVEERKGDSFTGWKTGRGYA